MGLRKRWHSQLQVVKSIPEHDLVMDHNGPLRVERSLRACALRPRLEGISPAAHTAHKVAPEPIGCLRPSLPLVRRRRGGGLTMTAGTASLGSAALRPIPLLRPGMHNIWAIGEHPRDVGMPRE